MNTNSNVYTIIYASVMVIIVAFVLAFVSSSLKETQDMNVRLDTKKQILSSINLRDSKDVAADYTKIVKDNLMQEDGTLVEVSAEDFSSEYNTQILDKKYHVFVCTLGDETKYIFPVYGAGLWGPIWGYVALNSDKKSVYGVYFGNEGETPGLGAEISTLPFQKRFDKKQVMKDGQVAIGVQKNAPQGDAYVVDGVSGGTITSKGVNSMLKACLSNYLPFLNK